MSTNGIHILSRYLAKIFIIAIDNGTHVFAHACQCLHTIYDLFKVRLFDGGEIIEYIKTCLICCHRCSKVRLVSIWPEVLYVHLSLHFCWIMPKTPVTMISKGFRGGMNMSDESAPSLFVCCVLRQAQHHPVSAELPAHTSRMSP